MGGEFFQCIKQRSFDHKKAGGVKERFAAVIKGTPSPSPRWANLLLVISFCLLLAVSYLFISQPAYDSSVLQNTPRIQYFDAEDSYILQKADGTYWLYTQVKAPEKLNDEELRIFKLGEVPVRKEEN